MRASFSFFFCVALLSQRPPPPASRHPFKWFQKEATPSFCLQTAAPRGRGRGGLGSDGAREHSLTMERRECFLPSLFISDASPVSHIRRAMDHSSLYGTNENPSLLCLVVCLFLECHNFLSSPPFSNTSTAPSLPPPTRRQ